MSGAHDEEMPHGLGPRGDEGQDEITYAGELGKITRGEGGAAGVPRGEAGEFHAQGGGGEFVEAGIEAGRFVVVTLARAVVAEGAEFSGEFGVVGRDRAGVGERAEIFSGIKTDARRVAERARGAVGRASAVGLRGVFEDEEAAARGEGVERGHVGALAVEVDRQEGFRARREEGGGAGGVEVVGALVAFARDGARAGVRDGEPRGDVAVGGHDHFVAGADPARHEDELQGFETVGHADAVRGADGAGVFLLEGGEFAAEEKLAGVHHAMVGGIEFAAQFAIGGGEIEEWNFHGAGNENKKGFWLWRRGWRMIFATSPRVRGLTAHGPGFGIANGLVFSPSARLIQTQTMMLFNDLVPRPQLRRITLVAGIFLGGLSALRAELPVVEGSMPEDYLPGLKPLLQAALKQGPQMILSEITMVQAEATQVQQDAQRYPNAGGVVQYSKGKSAVSGSASSGDSGLLYSFSAGQSLFQWGAMKNQSEIAKIGVLISQKNHAEAYRLFASSLRAQYMALVVKKAGLAGVKFRLKMSEAALEVETQKLKNGAISQGEMVSPTLNLEEARLAVDRAELDYAHSCRLFAHLVGSVEIEDGSIPTEIAKPVFSAGTSESLLALLRRDNGESTFAAQVAALYVRSADLGYKIARVRLLPKISASAGITQVNSTTASGGSKLPPTTTVINSQSMSVVASWSLFDGFATRGARMSSLATKRYYERSLQNQIQLTLDNAENLQRTLVINARALGLTEQRMQLLEATLNRVKEEAQLGNVPQAAVDETASAYYTYKNVLASARAAFLSSWSDFVSLTGADPAMNYLPARYVH